MMRGNRPPPSSPAVFTPARNPGHCQFADPESPFLPVTRQRQQPVLETKRRIYRFCVLLVGLSTAFLTYTLLRGQENYPSFWAYLLVCGVLALCCVVALLALRDLRNIRRVELFLTVASATYLFYWDIVALVSEYHPRAEFLMTSVTEFLLTAALLCITVPRRRLLPSLVGLFVLHDLLVWGNLLQFPWSQLHNAQLMSDLLTFVTMLALSLIGTYQDMVAVSHQEADLLEKLANTDTLTGLANRRQMYAQLQHLEHSGAAFGVLLLDIDDFKQVNDTQGHDIGDGVLVTVARILEGSVQQAGKVGRWGGEEFVVVVPESSPTQLAQLAEQLRTAIEQQTRAPMPAPMRVGASVGVGVTVSVGAALHGPGEGLDATLRRADEAMYAAKRNGKNRVVQARA